MIIRWSPGVLPSTGHYVSMIFNALTAGTANGTGGGGATPGTPTFDLSRQVVKGDGGGSAESSIVRM